MLLPRVTTTAQVMHIGSLVRELKNMEQTPLTSPFSFVGNYAEFNPALNTAGKSFDDPQIQTILRMVPASLASSKEFMSKWLEDNMLQQLTINSVCERMGQAYTVLRAFIKMIRVSIANPK